MGGYKPQPFLAVAQPSAAATAPVPPIPDCVSARIDEPVSKRPRLALVDEAVTDKLGEFIKRDEVQVRTKGLAAVIRERLKSNDWGNLEELRSHPAHRVLRNYKSKGIPVTLADDPWTPCEMKAALARGPHKSAYEFEEFLREDMASMVEKNQRMVVPYDAIADIPGLRLSPIGVVPQHA